MQKNETRFLSLILHTYQFKWVKDFENARGKTPQRIRIGKNLLRRKRSQELTNGVTQNHKAFAQQQKTNGRCWQRRGERGAFIHLWWECAPVPPLQNSLQRCSKDKSQNCHVTQLCYLRAPHQDTTHIAEHYAYSCIIHNSQIK